MTKKREVKDRETREREIQQAAKEIFYKKGYDDTSMADIAKAAKIAKGTTYIYYQNKGDLYISLMMHSTQDINDKLLLLEDRLITGKATSGRDIIFGLLDCFYDVYKADPDNVRIVAMFQQGDLFEQISKDTVEGLNQIARKNNMAMRRIIRIGKEQGMLKPEVNELMLPDILWATFTGVTQVERSRKRMRQKDHLHETLLHAFELLALAVCA